MRTAGRLAASVLDMIGGEVRPGVSTDDLDRICHDFIVDELGAIPAPLNYRGFPKSICTSVNHVVCHGIPGDRLLKDGDVLNIDITVIKDGYHGDTSRMFFVGKPQVLAERLATGGLRRDVARHRRSQARRSSWRHRQQNSGPCRSESILGRPRILRSRNRPRIPRGPAGAALRRARYGSLNSPQE